MEANHPYKSNPPSSLLLPRKSIPRKSPKPASTALGLKFSGTNATTSYNAFGMPAWMSRNGNTLSQDASSRRHL